MYHNTPYQKFGAEGLLRRLFSASIIIRKTSRNVGLSCGLSWTLFFNRYSKNCGTFVARPFGSSPPSLTCRRMSSFDIPKSYNRVHCEASD